MTFRNENTEREVGSALVLTILILVLLLGFSTSHFLVVQKNMRQSSFFETRSALRECAESGIQMSVHDLKFEVTSAPGKIGTEFWTPTDDFGRDGMSGTGDEGEWDAIPTPGEPNVYPVAVGPPSLGAGLVVYVEPTSLPEIQRIVATAANANAMVTVERYGKKKDPFVPRAGVIFLDEDAVLDINGDSLVIDGRDHNLDGTLGDAESVYGISTSANPDAPGQNKDNLAGQINEKNQDNINGKKQNSGDVASVGEVEIDFDEYYNYFKSVTTSNLDPGTYGGLTLGDHTTGDIQLNYVKGDLGLSGNNWGAGLLVVEGSLTITGSFSFAGLVVVRGDFTVAGGGADATIWGAVMMGQTVNAIEPDGTTLSGSTKFLYSSEALDLVQNALSPLFTFVYYDVK